MNSKPSTDRFRKTLASIRHESSGGRYFISPYDLKEQVTKDLIFDTVSECPFAVQHYHLITQRILERGLKLFSILVWMGQEDHMVPFVEHDELDSRLPMGEEQVLRIAPRLEKRFWEEVQWEFLPHMFVKGDYHRRIHDKSVLPFLEELSRAEGSYGEILESRITLSQQTFFPDKVCTSLQIDIQLFLTLDGTDGASISDQKANQDEKTRGGGYRNF